MCWIMRVMISKKKDLMLQLYKTLVRPHLEYCVQLWSPIPKHGNWGLIFKIEYVQRDFTRQIFGIGHLCYKDRLDLLALTNLVERRARGDLIETYKIFKGIANYAMGKNCSGSPEMDTIFFTQLEKEVNSKTTSSALE